MLSNNVGGKCIVRSLCMNGTCKPCVHFKKAGVPLMLAPASWYCNALMTRMIAINQENFRRLTKHLQHHSSATGYSTLTSVVLSGWLNLTSTPSMPQVDERWARWLPHCISTWDTQLSGWDLTLHWAQRRHVIDACWKECNKSEKK